MGPKPLYEQVRTTRSNALEPGLTGPPPAPRATNPSEMIASRRER